MSDDEALARAQKAAPIGSRWKHHKGGVYVVIGYGMLEREWEIAVTYISVNGGIPIHRVLREFIDGRFQRAEV